MRTHARIAMLDTSITRRTIVATGMRLTYGAPLVVASVVLPHREVDAQDLVSPGAGKPRAILALRQMSGLCFDIRFVSLAGNPLASSFRIVLEFDPGVLEPISFVPLVPWSVLDTQLGQGLAILAAAAPGPEGVLQGSADLARICFTTIGQSGDCAFISIRSEASEVLSLSPLVAPDEDILEPNFLARLEPCLP